MSPRLLAALAALALGACSDEPQPAGAAPEPAPAPSSAALPEGNLPLQAADYPALASPECAEVVRFYGAALAERAFERAALAWDDPVVDGARLEALFAAYQAPTIAWGEPSVEGAAGSLYCTVEGTLSDAKTPAAGVPGTLILRRVNDVPGAMADQLRWTIRSSTFVEPIERAGRGAAE